MSKIILFFLRFYQHAISPLFPPVCKFVPSCSNYALTAIERFGAWKGSLLVLKRLLRCSPFSRSAGFDPVPDKFD